MRAGRGQSGSPPHVVSFLQLRPGCYEQLHRPHVPLPRRGVQRRAARRVVLCVRVRSAVQKRLERVRAAEAGGRVGGRGTVECAGLPIGPSGEERFDAVGGAVNGAVVERSAKVLGWVRGWAACY